MKDLIPEFEPNSVNWAHTVLFQALITQLIESHVLSVADGERVFDLATQRAKKEINRAPDAGRLIAHIHDNLKWDDYYRWSVEKKNKGRNGTAK